MAKSEPNKIKHQAMKQRQLEAPQRKPTAHGAAPTVAEPLWAPVDNHTTTTLTAMFDHLYLDLILEIFLHISPPNIDKWERNWSTPYVLMQVCHYWREITLFAPELWTTLPTIDTTNIPISLEALRMHLDRTRDFPVDVAMRIMSGSESSVPLLQLILGYSHRWRSLAVDIDPDYLGLLSPLSGRKFPLLGVVKMNIRWRPLTLFSIAGQPPIFLESDLPALRHAIIDGLYTQHGLVLPYAQLTGFVGSAIDKFRPTATDLTTCVLRGRLSHLVMAFSDSVELPSLVYLRVDDQTGTFPGTLGPAVDFKILRYIVAPILQELDLATLWPSDFRMFDNLITLLCPARSSSVEVFRAKNLCFFPDDFVRVIQMLPSLVSLDVEGIPASHLKPLIIEAGNRLTSLPHLRYLTIRNFDGLGKEILTNISRSRLASNTGNSARLEPITLQFSSSKKCYAAQDSLECWDWVRYDPNLKRELGKVMGWRTYLAKQFLGRLPENRLKYPLSGVPKCWKYHITQNMAGLNTFLRSIETYEFSHSELLNHTRIHIIMRDVSWMAPENLPQDELYRFRSRAAALVEKWTPLLLSGLDNRHWAISDNGVVLHFVDWTSKPAPDPNVIAFS